MKVADSNLLDGKKEADRIAAVCGERIEKESPLRLKMLILVLFSVLELWEGRDTYASGKKGHFSGTSENFCGIFAELKKVLAFDCCFCYYI